jgi:hypothetical protein
LQEHYQNYGKNDQKGEYGARQAREAVKNILEK